MINTRLEMLLLSSPQEISNFFSLTKQLIVLYVLTGLDFHCSLLGLIYWKRSKTSQNSVVITFLRFFHRWNIQSVNDSLYHQLHFIVNAVLFHMTFWWHKFVSEMQSIHQRKTWYKWIIQKAFHLLSKYLNQMYKLYSFEENIPKSVHFWQGKVSL